MQILLIGLGSIGNRHLRNILSLGYKNVSIVTRSGILPGGFVSLNIYTNVSDALSASSYGAAIICTPTSMHVDSLQLLVAAKIPNIFVEKPISNLLVGLKDISEQAKAFGVRIVVGYDLHFDPGMQKVKQLLSDQVIGEVVSVNAQVGQYLPNWRPHEDYRQGMSARKAMGGGVMLDLIHEFDYLYWLFGRVNTIACFCSSKNILEIETEEVAEVILKFNSNIIGSIHLDYLQQKLIRNCLITGSNGSITWNLVESSVDWIDFSKNVQRFDFQKFERNERFIEIIKAFLSGEDDERLTGFNEGLESLKMVVAAKQSSEEQRYIDVSSINYLSN